MILRDYQQKAISDLRTLIKSGKRSLVLVSPTGSGKTSIAGEMIRSASALKKRILFLAHRKELIDQCSERLDSLGVAHGIIRANDSRRRPWLNVHVASVPTLIRRDTPQADLIFIDECHRAPGASYRKIIAEHPTAVFIGLTATPRRLDGKGLGSLFGAMVECPSVGELTERGFLVPARVYAPATLDLSKVGIRAGEYNNAQMAAVVDKPRLVGEAVSHWRRLAPDRLTISFAVNIEHSKHTVAEYQAAGIAAEHVDGEMSKAEREAVLKRFRAGLTRVVVNVGLFTEGTDIIQVSCIQLLRPTASESLFLQMCGRGLRPAPGKSDLIILDHANCTSQFGFVEDERQWSLDDASKKRASTDYDPALAIRTCKQCWCAYSSRQQQCPSCGFMYVAPEREIETVAGELKEVGRFVCSMCKCEMPDAKAGDACGSCGGSAQRAYQVKQLSKHPKIAAIQQEAAEKGWKPGAVWHRIQRLKETGGLRA